MREIVELETGHAATTLEPTDDLAARLASARPDLVLLDLRLGTRSGGITVARQIRADPRLARVPVVLVTADRAQTRRRLIEIARIPDVFLLHKPFELDALLGLFDSLLNRPSEMGTLRDTRTPAVVVTDEQGVICEANSAARRLLGYQRAELVGRPAVELAVWPAARVQMEGERLYATRRWSGETPVRRGDGSVVVLHASAVMLESDGARYSRVTLTGQYAEDAAGARGQPSVAEAPASGVPAAT
jgi:PAS domain S-box-containing protein